MYKNYDASSRKRAVYFDTPLPFQLHAGIDTTPSACPIAFWHAHTPSACPIAWWDTHYQTGPPPSPLHAGILTIPHLSHNMLGYIPPPTPPPPAPLHIGILPLPHCGQNEWHTPLKTLPSLRGRYLVVIPGILGIITKKVYEGQHGNVRLLKETFNGKTLMPGGNGSRSVRVNISCSS